MFPGAKLNTILNDSIRYPWRCRYWSRCKLWIMPVKATSMGSATTSSFLICIFHELNETLWYNFLCPSPHFFCLAWGELWAALLLLGGRSELEAAANFALLLRAVTHNVLPAWWRLLADFYFAPPTKKWNVPLTEAGGSSLLHTGKRNT